MSTMRTRISARLAGTLLAATLLGAASSAQQLPDRTRPPAQGQAPALKRPVIQRHTLANGLAIWIVEMHETPVVDLTMIVKSGAASDPEGLFGVANFTSAMLDEGAGTRSALDLADAVDFLGATLGTSSSFDASTVHLHALAPKLDDALPLFADVILRPTFPAADLDRVRKERLTGLLQSRDNAASIASAAFARVLYGERHRYGTPLIGNEAANTRIGVGDLRAFHGAHYEPRNACLIVVGDVTRSEILPKLERAFGGWSKSTGAARPGSVLATPARAARRIVLVDKPGAAQSQIRIGTIGVARTTPDYHVLDVLNTTLGGSFSSRLNQNLRETHGYSYGASSRFDMRGSAGPFVAGAGVQADKTTESLQEFFKELEGMHVPIGTDELRRVRNLQAFSFPGGFETTANVAAKLADLVVYGLPETFFSDYVPRIQAVSAAAAKRAADTYLPMGSMVTVVVGDLASIERPVRAANLGPVEVLTLDQVFK